MLFTAVAAWPQCSYQFQYSGEYRASILDLWIDGSDLWAATGYGVQLYDRSVDPPRLVASIGLPGVTSIVRSSFNTAYAGTSNGITVLRHVGNRLIIVQNVPVTGLNDLIFTPATIYAATSSGIVAFNVSDMSQSPATFPTSSPAVTSIVLSGSTVYAADGDNSIEVFSIPGGGSPQKLGTVTTALRATSVEMTSSRLFVSDGIRSEVFTGSGAALTSLGTLPFAMRSLADLGANVVMMAGADRQLRAIDATLPQNYVELFDTELPPSAGTINRVTAMQLAGGRLYVGAGDIGLATFDVSHFAPPFPLRSYGTGAATSIVAAPAAFYVALPAGGIQQLTRNASGAVTTGRVFDSGETATVQDATSDGFLLTSSGSAVTFWTVNSFTAISQATFAAPVRSAFFNGTASAVVLLQDGTLWTVDLSQQSPAPVRVASAFNTLTLLGHSSAGTAATEVSADATSTAVHFWSGNDLNATPLDVRLPGAATALALNGSTASVFTFQGITTIDFTTSTTLLLPGSNAAITTALAMSGGKVIAETQGGTVQVWDIASRTLQRQFTLLGGVNAITVLQGSTTVGLATPAGVATIDLGVATAQPALTARLGGNTYYKKAVAGGTHLYLFDGRVIDIFNLQSTNAPEWSGSVVAPGVIDIAASNTALYALSNNEVVTEYSPAGVLLRSQPLDEGADATSLGITIAGGAPWVSVSRGCTTTSGCQKKTDVLDPQSLVSTASLPGGAVDVSTSGTRAYAIFDLPSEIRVYNVSDPLHPSPLATRANDANAVAIAAINGTVYALADKVYAYSESALTPSATQLTAVKPGSFADLLIDNGCATIAGRTPSAAERYTVPDWTTASLMGVPGNIRSMVIASGRLIVLTDDSLEIWSRNAAPVPPKRRGAGTHSD